MPESVFWNVPLFGTLKSSQPAIDDNSKIGESMAFFWKMVRGQLWMKTVEKESQEYSQADQC